MTNIIEISAYNPQWPAMFAAEAASIKEVLGSNLIEIHHVGSTSVPGLIAKPKLDIVAEVKNRVASIPALSKLGYDCRGEMNIPFRLYCRKKLATVEINLHVYEEGNPEIKLNLMFRDYLRSSPEACAEYAALKQRLISKQASHEKNNSIFTGYNLGKDAFIRSILAKSGFNELRLAFCTHYNEWEIYHRIREEQLFAPMLVVYDRNHPSLSSKDFYHFVLYKGVEVATVAMVEFPKENYAILRSLATDEQYKGKGYGAHILKLLEKWMKQHGYSMVKLHSAPNAEKFYRRFGYMDIEFDDIAMDPDAIDLGKRL